MRRAWALPRKITVSEWADAHRELDTKTGPEGGRWRTSRTPYLRGIMDAFNDPWVREITVMKGTQLGGTECMLNMLGYCAAEDPGPTLWVGPDENIVRSFCAERIQPMFSLSEDLIKHLFSMKREEFNKAGITLDRMNLHIAWAGSAGKLASRPVRNVFLDELDKFPAFAGREASPIKLASERTKNFWNRRIVKVSTPTTKEGYIYREYEKSDKRMYHVPCPHCGTYQPLVFGQVRVPEDEHSPQKIQDEHLAWYECVHCQKKIFDYHKQSMLEAGVWVPEGAEVTPDGQRKNWPKRKSSRAGFWINSIYSPWLTFSDIMAEFFSSKDDPETLMNFVNSWLAETFDEKDKETDENDVKKLCVDYPEGVVPDPVQVLTGAVDVHSDEKHFYLTIRGWAKGPAGLQSWLIRKSRLETFSDIANALFNTEYAKSNNVTMKVRASVMDSGYRTDEVYKFCRHYIDKIAPTKGFDTLNGLPYRSKKIDKLPNGKPLPGGVVVYDLDTNYYKDKLHRQMHPESMDDASWFVFNEPGEDYIKQMCSEHKVPKRAGKKKIRISVWEQKTSAAQNHYWDCEVYQLLVSDILRLDMLENPDGSRQNVYRGDDEKKPSWLGNTAGVGGMKGWVRG